MRIPVIVSLSVLALPLTATLLHADCAHRASLADSAPFTGGTVRIEAAAGDLTVRGGADGDEVRVDGTACASSDELLRRIRLSVTEDGDGVAVLVELPEASGFRSSASLDLVVELPSEARLDVDDSSGSIVISGVGGVDVDDSSGDLEISDIGGPVVVDDGSGNVVVRSVRGSVILEDTSGDVELEAIEGDVVIEDDGSGDIAIRTVGGSVTVEDDGSGDILVREVVGDVVVRDDGSGSITVERVGGDLSVGDDGSGGIDYRDVAGEVSLPSDA